MYISVLTRRGQWEDNFGEIRPSNSDLHIYMYIQNYAMLKCIYVETEFEKINSFIH